MSTHYTAPSRLPTRAATRSLSFLRAFSLLSVLNILFQGVTAGRILMESSAALEFHQAGAIALHILAGLTVIATGEYWRSTRGAIWPLIVTTSVFIASFVQAAYGSRHALYIHVPLALGLLFGGHPDAVLGLDRNKRQPPLVLGNRKPRVVQEALTNGVIRAEVC